MTSTLANEITARHSIFVYPSKEFIPEEASKTFTFPDFYNKIY